MIGPIILVKSNVSIYGEPIHFLFVLQIVEWFAERADLIMLLFDAHKLDISDEFKDTIHALKGQEDKV